MRQSHFNLSIPHFYDFYAMYRCTKEHPIKPNWHSELEMFFTFEGENTFLINGEEVTLKKDDIFIVNPNFPHSSLGEPNGYTSLLTIKNDFLMSNGFKEINGVFTDKINDDVLFEKYNALLDIHFSNSTLREVDFRIALLDLLRYVFNNYYKENEIKSTNQKTKEILKYLNDNYTENITLKDLAEKFNYNKNYLSSLFKRDTGFSIIEYINIMRCNYADSLIKGTNIKFNEIAEMCGFQSVSNFNKTYKLLRNKTPNETRKSHNQYLQNGKGAGTRYKK